MTETKYCKRCKKDKPLDDFYKRLDSPGYRTYCRPCQADYLRMWKYNISPEEFQNMLIEQNFKCAICFKEFKDTVQDSPRVDHCHKTEKIRGLLCNLCNSGIGKLGDSILSLTQASAYIAKWDQLNGLYREAND